MTSEQLPKLSDEPLPEEFKSEAHHESNGSMGSIVASPGVPESAAFEAGTIVGELLTKYAKVRVCVRIEVIDD